MYHAVIPAKFNSSRVPGKNFSSFYGSHSLVDLSLSLACSFSKFKNIILSTDNTSYTYSSNSLIQYHHRSPSLATKLSPVVDTLKDIVSHYSIPASDYIILLQPTSPFRDVRSLTQFISFLQSSTSSSQQSTCLSVYKVEDAHPSRMYTMDSSFVGSSFIKEQSSLQCQELDAVYHRNGCFYAIPVSSIILSTLYTDIVHLFEMPQISSVNIDTPLDMLTARMLYPMFADGKL